VVAADAAGKSVEQFVAAMLAAEGRQLRALTKALLDDDLKGDADEVVDEAIKRTTISASRGKLRRLSSGDIGELAGAELDVAVRRARAYLWRTAVWICYGRNKKKRPLLVEHPAEGLAGREVDPFETVAAAETKSQVWAALRALPLDDQQILVLRFIRGFSYKRIAEVIGVPVGTVRSRIHRACGKARKSKAFKRLYTTLYPDDAPKGRWP